MTSPAPQYLPIDGRALRVTMGTRPLDLADWIEIDEGRAMELAEKDRLFAEERPQVLAMVDEGRAGAEETLELLVGYLPERFPDIYGRCPQGVVDKQRDIVVPLDSGDPLEVAGRLVQEDLCVMRRDSAGAWVLVAASLCFPSRWSLLEKIGRDMAAIHAPVPFYADRIGSPADQFFDRLSAGRPVWRLNWTILDSPELFQPRTRRWQGVPDGQDLGDVLNFRVERQTLRLLPRTGDILFTIRTYVRTLTSLGTTRPGVYADLAATLRQTPSETAAYKGWTSLMGELLDWLETRN